MTTGAPLYLVSACASAEEFVAAFRRYADRSGLFVPIADPLPQGRRGRIALALKDGRIVLEGEVEIAVSNSRPSPLYGRVGMTLKFVEPDAPTKTTLGELEKARLAMKPPPLSIPPRAGEVPAEPRPTVPPTGGRIDASNALAECVAIGDLAAWTGAAPKGDSAKFVIPTIPQMGAPRPKTPSVPPALQPKLPVEAKPPPTPGSPPPIVLPSTVKEQKATTMGMPAIDRLPAAEAKSTDPELPVISKSMTKQGIEPPRPTTMGMPPVLRAPVSALREPTPIPRREPTQQLPKKGDAIQIPKRQAPVIGKQTTLGMPIVRPPADTLESPAPPPPPTPRRAHTPSTPPAPRHPTPYAPLPIVRMPALAHGLDETTERTGIPEAPPIGGEQRKTSLGIQMMTASPVETGWDDPEENKATEQQDAVDAPAETPASRSGGLRASEIMAAIQGEDWTMTPDASTPTVLPKDEPKDLDAKAAEEKSGPLPGDWAISLDPAAPGGWSAPAKVEKPPELKAPAVGNRNIAVASAQPIEAVEWEEKPTGIGEALVQIDPSLLDPGKPAEEEEPVNIVSTPIADVPPPRPPPTPMPFNGASLPLAAPALTPGVPMSLAATQPPPLPPPPLVATYPTPPPIPPSMFPPATPLPPPPLPNASASYPAIPFVVDPTDSIQTKRKRTIVLAIAAAVAVALTVVVILWTSGGKKSAKPNPIVTGGSGSAVHVAIPEGSGSAQVVHPPPPPPPPEVDAGVAAPQVCDVEVTTNPTGAEITVGDAVVGTSPATVQLPCGVETKVTAKKAKFGSATRSITASATANKLGIKIAAPMFQLKVTSVPSGATVTVGGKVVGITPTAVKVTAFSPTMITLTKDGYTADTEKIAPRVNNATHHVVLKRSVKQKLR